MKTNTPKVAIIMGSDSDLPALQAAADACAEFGIACDVRVVSARRTPMEMVRFAKSAHDQEFQVIIAGADGAAYLPGMVASLTPLPVIGVPVERQLLKGLDSQLSIVQMPGGVPVATMAINGGRSAGLLDDRVFACGDPKLLKKITEFQTRLASESKSKNRKLQSATKSYLQA